MKEAAAMKKEWFPAVNGWKGILALLILLLHSEPFFYGGQVHFETGYLAVDCFFVLSGFFLVRSLDKAKDQREPVVTVMASRLKKLYPLYIICLGLYLLLYAVMPQLSLDNIDKTALAGEFFLLQMSGFVPYPCLNWPDWYISAMMLAMPILAALHTWHRRSFYHIVAPLLILTIDCWFFQINGSLDIHMTYYGYFRGGFLRAVSGMCWGCLTYQAYQWFAAARDTLKEKARPDVYTYMYSVVEVICAGVILRLHINWHHSVWDFFVPLVFSVLVICAALGEGVVSRVLKLPPFQFLGNISTSLLLTQLSVFTLYGIVVTPRMQSHMVLCQCLCIAVQILWAWCIHTLVEKKAVSGLWRRVSGRK